MRATKKEIRIPQPRQLPSGSWNIQLRLEGKSISVTEDTEALCRAKATAIKAGMLTQEREKKAPTLGVLIDDYIADKRAVLSPSTIRGYNAIRKGRFKAYMDKQANKINYQRMISDERNIAQYKTVKNAWGLASAALKAGGITPPDNINFGQHIKTEKQFLSADQIDIFLEGARGRPCELCALLALHGLRASEIKDLTPEDIDAADNIIHVRGAAVRGESGLVHKATNKNSTSRRDVPIFLPRLLELIPAEGEYIVPQCTTNLRDGINLVCRKNGLPEVGIHGLRHSFASIALITLQMPTKTVMQLGGWATDTVMRDIYTHYAREERQKDAAKLIEYFAAKR